MSKLTEKVAEQAEKIRVLKAEIQLGLDDEAACRVRPWDLADFLRRAREKNSH